MYGLSVEEKELFLTKAFLDDDTVVTIATFVVPFGSSKSDVVKLGKEMVAVLNRDLENRANDIANNPPGFTERPDYSVPDTGSQATCDNPACACNQDKDLPEPVDAIPGQVIADHALGLETETNKEAFRTGGTLHCDGATGIVVLGCPGCAICLPRPGK